MWLDNVVRYAVGCPEDNATEGPSMEELMRSVRTANGD